MAMIVTVECPACATAFPVDPDKVPVGGARTECTVCGTDFRVDPPSWDGDEPGGAEPWSAETGEEAGEASWEEDARAFEELAVEDAADGLGAGDEPFGMDGIADQDFGADAITGETLSGEGESVAMDGLAEEPLAMDGVADEPLAMDGLAEEAPEIDGFVEETVEVQGFAEETFEVEGTEDGFSDLADLDSVIPMHGTGVDAATGETSVDNDGSYPSDEDREGALTGDSGPVTGDLVTDQWADLMDGEEEGEVEISSDWGEGEADPWIIETEEDVGLAAGGLEVERLGTVEDQVRAAQDDPGLTAPAEGVDTNEMSDPEFEGFGDFMSGQETVLPEDALEIDGSGLQLHSDEDRSNAEEGDLPHSVGFGSEGDDGTDPPEAEGPAVGEDEGHSTFQFGRRDPHDKARRLARVLVSDMITYNPDRHAQARQNGSVKEDFEEEIQKSWAEYVEQVGPELAESTDYWRDALNDILAGDEPLF